MVIAQQQRFNSANATIPSMVTIPSSAVQVVQDQIPGSAASVAGSAGGAGPSSSSSQIPKLVHATSSSALHRPIAGGNGKSLVFNPTDRLERDRVTQYKTAFSGAQTLHGS